jgi:OOP family OmpA-OmpF porin
MTFAQVEKKFNSFSIETAYGYVSPSNLVTSPNQQADYASFNHFDLGVRYMIDSKFGVKVNYARDCFSHEATGLTYNTISASAVYNVGSLFNLTYSTNERLGLLAHLGAGFTFAKPESIDETERIGTARLGLTPQFRISDRIGLYADVSYAIRFKQHYGFDGVLLSPEYKDSEGKTTTFSLGLMFYIGDKAKHADWY